MITTAEEYYSHLFQIQDHNAPSLALLLPRDEIIYNIDLNTRKIEAPNVLSAQYDHYAETIYFSVDRYFDNMDLTNTVCVVQFINEKKEEEGHLYVVPFYDITYFQNENKILFPWCIGEAATKYSGIVTFSIRFYKLNDNEEIIYNLNTLSAKSEVLHGLDTSNFLDTPTTDATELDKIWNAIKNLKDQDDLYWIEYPSVDDYGRIIAKEK